MEREHKSTAAELFDPLTPLSMTVVGVAVVILLAVGVALLGGVPGCALRAGAGSIGGGLVSPGGVPTGLKASGEFAYVGWLAGVTLTIAVGLFVASFWVPAIAVKTAAGCLAASIGLFALKYALEKYLHIAVTLGVIIAAIGGAVALFPVVHTWINLHLRGVAKKIESANPAAAQALIQVADGGLGLEKRLKKLGVA